MTDKKEIKKKISEIIAEMKEKIDSFTMDDINNLTENDLPSNAVELRAFQMLISKRIAVISQLQNVIEATYSETEDDIPDSIAKKELHNIDNQDTVVEEDTLSPLTNIDKMELIIQQKDILNKELSVEREKKKEKFTVVTPQKNVKTNPFKGNKDYYLKKHNIKKSLSSIQKGFCFFASSSESIMLSINNKKVTAYINGISHESELSKTAKECKNFLNHNLKKKAIYVDVLSILDDETILVDVYGDMEKRSNLIYFLEKEGLATSIFEEKDAVLFETPDNIKETNNSKMNNSDIKEQFCDMQEKNPSENVEINLFTKYKNEKTDGVILCYYLESGEAPYNFDESKSKSFYFKIKLHNKENYIWGQNLKDVVKKSNLLNGDFIKITKEQIKSGNFTKNIYNVSILEKINKDIDNDVVENIVNTPVEENQNNNTENYDENINSVNNNYDNSPINNPEIQNFDQTSNIDDTPPKGFGKKYSPPQLEDNAKPSPIVENDDDFPFLDNNTDKRSLIDLLISDDDTPFSSKNAFKP